MLKKIINSLIPPLFFIIFKKSKEFFDNPDFLFDGDDNLFKDEIKKCNVYGEYGCGKSTKWVLNNTSLRIISVDTSKEWVEKVKENNENNDFKLNIQFIDLGEIGFYGTPNSYLKASSFYEYTDYLWNQIEKPNLVLIDGRFRVCCFLTIIKFADPGTKIIFDDYLNRPYYHFVEKYLKSIKSYGRQSLFIVPEKNILNLNELEKDINHFRYVMD